MGFEQTLHDLIFSPFLTIYLLIQNILDYVLSPTPPAPTQKPGKRNIAVIGAGLTGVSAASHCVGHGFDVKIFEAGDRKAVGGIWAVSCTSTRSPRLLLTYLVSESEQHLRPADQFDHVPLPALR